MDEQIKNLTICQNNQCKRLHNKVKKAMSEKILNTKVANYELEHNIINKNDYDKKIIKINEKYNKISDFSKFMECTTKKCKNIVDKIKELKKQEFNPLFK
jgi:hypothetical protein